MIFGAKIASLKVEQGVMKVKLTDLISNKTYLIHVQLLTQPFCKCTINKKLEIKQREYKTTSGRKKKSKVDSLYSDDWDWLHNFEVQKRAYCLKVSQLWGNRVFFA